MALVSVNVETFPHLDIAGEPIDVEGLPFEDGFFRKSVPAVIEHVSGSRDSVLASPSDMHGRSYELLFSDQESENQVWADRFGNPYTALTTKGNNFSDAKMIKSATAPSGFIPYGLQEGDAMLRVLRASEVMRESGIDTEWIVRIEEPKKLAYKGQLYEIDEFKRRLVGDLVARTAMKGAGLKSDGLPVLSQEEIGELSKKLKDMDFFITLRAMATPYRVRDIVNEELFNYTALLRVFDDYNKVAPYRKGEFEELGLPSEVSIPPINEVQKRGTDIELYFCDILPKLMGRSFGKLHNLGLTHSFPHLLNFTGLGGIVDLDSVKGEAIGLNDDSVIDNKAIADDFWHLFGRDTIKQLYGSFNTVYTYFEPGEDWNPLHQFCDNFLQTYLKTRGFDKTFPDGQAQLIELLSEIQIKTGWQLPTDYLTDIVPEAFVKITKENAEKLAGQTVVVNESELATRIYQIYIEGNEQDQINYLKEHLSWDGKTPLSVDVLKQAINDSMVWEGDEANKELENYNITDVSGGWEIAEDIFNDDVLPYLLEQRFASIYQLLPEMVARLETEHVDNADMEVFEHLQSDTVLNLIAIFCKEVIKDNIKDFIVNNPDAIWETMALKLKEYLDNQTLVELYPLKA